MIICVCVEVYFCVYVCARGVWCAGRCIYVKATTGEWRLSFPDGSSAGRLSAPSRQAEPETVEVYVLGGCKYCGHFGATLMLPTLQPVSDPCPACPSCEVDFLPPTPTPTQAPSHGIGLLPLAPQTSPSHHRIGLLTN